MKVGNKSWTNWNKAPLKLWQTQLNFVVCCASSACGVSFEHLNYKKHSMVKAVYRFHMYYHVRGILKRLQVPLPHRASFNAADNPYTNKEFFKICEVMEFLMILKIIGMKSFIGLISMVLDGQMITLIQT